MSPEDHVSSVAANEWRTAALCSEIDPELWFPEPGEDEAAAKLICGWCPVRAACLAYALDAHEDYGVWGGLSADERRRMRETAAAVPAFEGEAA